MWPQSPFWQGFFTLLLIELVIVVGIVIFAIVEDILRSPRKEDPLDQLVWTYIEKGKLHWQSGKKK
jgi:hypothetical protein